jgi:hypothetical protein
MRALARGECNGAFGVGVTAVELFLNFMPQFQVLPLPESKREAIVFNRKVWSRKERETLYATLRSAGLEAVAPGHSAPIAVAPLPLDAGARVSVLTWNLDWAHQRLALAVRRALGPRGGEVLALPPAGAAEALSQGGFGIVIVPIQTWPGPEALARWRTGGPFAGTGYSNADLDAAIAAGDWRAAQRAFDLDPPGVLLLEWTTYAVFDSRIFNPTLGRYRLLETLPSWEVP